MTVPNWALRRARTSAQLTISDLSARTGIPAATLAGIERGADDIQDLPASRLAVLASVLHISADSLIGLSSPDS